MEELFFSSGTFFRFSRGDNRSGDLRWPWRGVPKSLVPTVLSRAVHSFCRLHTRGRVKGLHLIVCRPLRIVSHTTGSCHRPSRSQAPWRASYRSSASEHSGHEAEQLQ